MKRLLISLATSAAIVSLSTGAYALSKLDTSHSGDNGKNGSIILAQATGGAPGTSSGGPTATTPEEQVKGTRKTDTDPPAAPAAAPNATDTTGASGTVDASQSKRKDTTEPAQSGAK